MKKVFTLLFFTYPAMHLISQTCNALDPNFGSGGIRVGLTSNDWLSARNIVVQPDNKVIQFGSIYSNGNHFSIVRYNSDGSIDDGFGQNGQAFSFISQSDQANYGALQNDGKILVAGTANYGSFVLARFNQNGTPDNSFGSNGTVIATPSDPGNFASALAIQLDEKIVAVGSTVGTDDCLTNTWGYQFCPNHFTVFRYKNNGSLDSSFGQNGKVVTPVGPDHAGFASLVVLQPDGKILVAGSYLYNLVYDDYYGSYYFASSHFAMVRYHSNGVVDSSFGKNGIVADVSDLQGTSAMSLQADGKILVTGYGGLPFEIERYNSDGSPDTTFGMNGQLSNNFESWASSILVLPNGKISVAGATRYNFLMTRINPDGSFDTSFNGNGKLSLHLGPVGSYDNATAIALQGDHVIVGGASNYGGNSNSHSQLILRLLDSISGLSLFITPRSTLTPCQGGSTRLVVNESGTIQWFNEGIPITDAKDTVFTAYQSGNYSVTVQNARGCGESDPVRVSVNGLPIVITPSSALTFCQGDSVTLTISESGNLQWYKDNIIIPGADDTAYTARSAGSYFVSVQNAKGCGQSPPVNVNVNPVKPAISWDGTILRTSSSSYSYQWYLNGDSIAGATTYLFRPTQLGVYKVVIPDYTCNNTSDEFNLDCNIIGVPQPSISWSGSTLATAAGFANYQWYFNGDSITGANTPLLTPGQMGIYKVTVTGSFNCQRTSNDFDVNCSVLGPPPPPNVWDGTKFSVASGYAHYQWYRDDTAIAGANANSYTPDRTQFGDYKVVVTDNNNCSNTSNVLPYRFTAVTNVILGDVQLHFYPNPASFVFNIDISGNIAGKPQAELYDLSGRLVHKKFLNRGNNQLSVERLSAGLYQLLIYNGSEKTMVKIAVIK